MKPRSPLVHRMLLAVCPPLFVAVVSQAAEPLADFTESRGCRIIGSPSSVARLQEIAAQGTVTWDGKCINGLIDGQGALRHQGVVRENERNRRYAFYLTGTAAAGKRQGTWLRETFNMFEDSQKYWTSLATIAYVDGISRGSPKLVTVRSNADFTGAFRQLLAETDRQLAAAQARPEESPPPRPAVSSVAAPAPTAGPAPAPSAPAAGLSPSVPTAPPASASAAGDKAASASTMQENQKAAAASAATRATARGGDPVQAPATSGAFQGRGLQPMGETGLRLGPGATASAQPQKILEQTSACYVDEINETIVSAEPIVASAADSLRISGWAADPRGPRIPELAWIRLFDRGGGPGLLVEMPRNTERPDVAKAMGAAVYAKAGFRLTLAAGKLAAGEYTVAIVQQLGSELAVCTAVGRVSLR